MEYVGLLIVISILLVTVAIDNSQSGCKNNIYNIFIDTFLFLLLVFVATIAAFNDLLILLLNPNSTHE